MSFKQLCRVALGICLLPALGCASLATGPRADVTIDSNPSNAHVVIRNRKGEQVASAVTPAVVTLERGHAYWLPARYTATIESPGYQPEEFTIAYTVNPWVYGNVVVGGIFGLIVDNTTGAMWKPKQDSYCPHLRPIGEPTMTPLLPPDQLSCVPEGPRPLDPLDQMATLLKPVEESLSLEPPAENFDDMVEPASFHPGGITIPYPPAPSTLPAELPR